MEQKLAQSNITFSVPNVILITAIITVLVLLGIGMAEFQPVSYQPEKKEFVADTNRSTDGIVQLSITSKNTGTGIVNLGGYFVSFDFKFEAQLRDYGLTESHDADVTIIRLDIGKIKNTANGEFVDDFTNDQDHRQINEAIKNFIEVHQLVEVR
ncbi:MULTISPECIES: hypothetical protein [unclassified Acinetobacter]|uniref:hypothetical protein n=1 Tax=unclassified Acinetobacter TaxID=196816 RepID=UPI0024476287|nr:MULTISPECIES: hypothetical protein [unclassified Acinetobacter]MDH0032528.1 hypothetical protein [Acinetobacter sp. GD04021]MDH0885219.1 hypothetical protein [Acinetobacter sp. GD03873]MDH1084453.1 hypothetical protein [Acinetobacter sp. GD03983]MDH2188341.1 hypothetical protein [Acinetobacter sp. GD03645]MDH2203852.1 hypothetical protein [Acinetobacter sp. GD03647]